MEFIGPSSKSSWNKANNLYCSITYLEKLPSLNYYKVFIEKQII